MLEFEGQFHAKLCLVGLILTCTVLQRALKMFCSRWESSFLLELGDLLCRGFDSFLQSALEVYLDFGPKEFLLRFLAYLEIGQSVRNILGFSALYIMKLL